MTLRSTAALLATLACLPAQTDAAPIEPLTPQVVLETVGPDGWRARLGPTNLGGLAASEEGRALWQPLVEPMLGAWAGMLGGQDVYREASERVFGYGGVVRFAWHRVSGGPVSFAIVIDGDGSLIGTGHGDVFSHEGYDYLVHHARDADLDYAPVLNVRRLDWDAEGWPRACLSGGG